VNPRLRLLLTSPWFRWSVVVVVLVVAITAAVLPRDGGRRVRDGGVALPSVPGVDNPAVDNAVTGAARNRAALGPCPATGNGSGTLSGLRVVCLGDGRTVDTSTVFGGRPMLVNVWATWCSSCQAELPLLARYAAGPGTVPVLEVQVDSAATAGLGLLTGLGIHLPTVYDGDGSLARALRLPKALPANYVVDARGDAHFIASPRVFRSVDDIARAVADGRKGYG